MGIIERKEREKERRRNAIIDAAEEVFFSKGVEDATMDEVAERAELSKGTLYLYFKNKNDLFHGIIARALEILYNTFKTEIEKEEKGIDKIRAIGRAYYGFYKNRPDYYSAMMHQDIQELDPEKSGENPNIAVCQETGNEIFALISECVEVGIKDGTIRQDLDPAEVLWRMFNRWRQENFFKYMLQEFAIDGLVEYGGEGVNPELDRPNPEHQALSKEIEAIRARIGALQSHRCELIGEVIPANEPDAPAGWERFSPDRTEANRLLAEVGDLKRQLQELEARRAEVPERISAEGLQRLKTERQQVAAVFKVAAYNIETELVRMVEPHYARAEDEGRKLIAAALRSSADLEVVGDELRVTLAPQSSPHRSRAIAALCTSLNKDRTTVPGTRLRLVLDCAVPEPDDVSS